MAINVAETFNEIQEAYAWKDLDFDKVEVKLHARRDLAFIFLDKLVPGKGDMVSGADHDIIFLDVEEDDLAKVATKEDILQLVRSGVFWSDEHDCIAMFV